MLTGCVQRGLFGRVNVATRRVLEANGYEVVEIRGQGCCGALHAHAGDVDGARSLARANLAAFSAADLDHVVVNAAGCGAAMREYGHLLGSEEAEDLSRRVRDVSEVLADAGPVPGAPLELSVALDSPCHLLHAQRVTDAPQKMLAAIPGLDVRMLPGAEECCGGAGIYGITHPDLGGRIGADKVDDVLGCEAAGVATGNPGCMMQIGAGLRMRGSDLPVWHPVELLDESYRRAGYRSGGDSHA
jgi:glycolate oxidase iron-sulfur subunit